MNPTEKHIKVLEEVEKFSAPLEKKIQRMETFWDDLSVIFGFGSAPSVRQTMDELNTRIASEWSDKIELRLIDKKIAELEKQEKALRAIDEFNDLCEHDDELDEDLLIEELWDSSYSNGRYGEKLIESIVENVFQALRKRSRSRANEIVRRITKLLKIRDKIRARLSCAYRESDTRKELRKFLRYFFVQAVDEERGFKFFNKKRIINYLNPFINEIEKTELRFN